MYLFVLVLISLPLLFELFLFSHDFFLCLFLRPHLDSKSIQEGCSVKASHWEIFHPENLQHARFKSEMRRHNSKKVGFHLNLPMLKPELWTSAWSLSPVILSSLSAAVSLAFVCSSLTPSHSLFPAHAMCPLHPLSTTFPLLCVHSSLRLGSSVCMRVCGCVSHLRIRVSRELV